ncbi:MAG: transglutaminase-like domain-containing protein [Bacillota bacterium]|nr:transglutaminase-like domain-containing protein [Bacillota bacterium]
MVRTTFNNVGTSEVRSGYVDVPLVADLHGSTQELVLARITPEPIEIREDGLGNRVGRFDLAHIPAGGRLVISQEYKLAYSGAAQTTAEAGVRPEYLSSESKIETDAPEVQALARQLSRPDDDPMAQAVRIYQRTRSVVKYDSNSPARNQGALAALAAGSGVCEEYACLFAALCRASGLPSRIIHGFARDRDSARSAWTGIAGTGVSLAPYRHAWAEVYLEGLGWLVVDPTYNRSDLDGAATKAVAPGVYIGEGYVSSPVTGRYIGGNLQAERKETLDW